MCRIAAYLGPPVSLQHFLLSPPHGLMEQSWAPREMQEAKLNADGFGFGWFPSKNQPEIYTNPMPIWTDPNLEGLGHTLSADLWLAYVRSATRRTDVSHANTQPFRDNALLFTHNGFIDQFGETLRHSIRHALETRCEKTIHGNTDSEYLFALLRQQLMDGVSVEAGLRQLFKLLEGWADDVKLLLNFVVAEKDRIVATRHAINGNSPSLYYCINEESFPGGQLVASEPLTESKDWKAIPEHHSLILQLGQAPLLEKM